MGSSSPHPRGPATPFGGGETEGQIIPAPRLDRGIDSLLAAASALTAAALYRRTYLAGCQWEENACNFDDWRFFCSSGRRGGKLELRVSTQQGEPDPWPTPSPEQLNKLSRLDGQVQAWMPQARGLSVNEVLQWFRGGSSTERLDEPALEAVRRCLAGLREARAREGDRLATMLRDRVRQLRDLAARAGPLVPLVVQRQQQRFLDRWHEALGSARRHRTCPRSPCRSGRSTKLPRMPFASTWLKN